LCVGPMRSTSGSLSMGVHELGHERQCSCLNSAFWNSPPMSTSMLMEISPQLEDNRRLGIFVHSDVDASVSTSLFVVLSLRPYRRSSTSAPPSWTRYLPSFSRHCVNVATSDPLAQAISGVGASTSSHFFFSLLSRASSNLGTVFWTRHRLRLRKSRDCGNLRSLLWWSTNLDAGASVSSTFVFRN
jgi:hypothetical protein